MAFERLPAKDPRTVARDIPGIFESLFPQLVPGIITHFNRRSVSFTEIRPVPDRLVDRSSLSRAMLFELACARAEQVLEDVEKANWDDCLQNAVERQRNHYDAKIPEEISEIDIEIAEWVASNLVFILRRIQSEHKFSELIISPPIPGYQWIQNGKGDYSIGDTIIEVKCSGKNFSSADYRQVVMYWLLSYALSIENSIPEWENGILINPRLNKILSFKFDEILLVIGSGRSKVELLEQFSSTVGDYTTRMLTAFEEFSRSRLQDY